MQQWGCHRCDTHIAFNHLPPRAEGGIDRHVPMPCVTAAHLSCRGEKAMPFGRDMPPSTNSASSTCPRPLSLLRPPSPPPTLAPPPPAPPLTSPPPSPL